MQFNSHPVARIAALSSAAMPKQDVLWGFSYLFMLCLLLWFFTEVGQGLWLKPLLNSKHTYVAGSGGQLAVPSMASYLFHSPSA